MSVSLLLKYYGSTLLSLSRIQFVSLSECSGGCGGGGGGTKDVACSVVRVLACIPQLGVRPMADEGRVDGWMDGWAHRTFELSLGQGINNQIETTPYFLSNYVKIAQNVKFELC